MGIKAKKLKEKKAKAAVKKVKCGKGCHKVMDGRRPKPHTTRKPPMTCSKACFTKCALNSCAITLYKHCNYGGYRIKLLPGSYDLKTLRKMGMKNDDISSIKVHGKCVAKMYQHHHFGGKVLTKTSNDSCFTNDPMTVPVAQLLELIVSEEADDMQLVQHHTGLKTFNDQISSVKVTGATKRLCTRTCHTRCTVIGAMKKAHERAKK